SPLKHSNRGSIACTTQTHEAADAFVRPAMRTERRTPKRGRAAVQNRGRAAVQNRGRAALQGRVKRQKKPGLQPLRSSYGRTLSTTTSSPQQPALPSKSLRPPASASRYRKPT